MPSTHHALYYHLIFSTKNREKWFTEPLIRDLHQYLGGIIRAMDGIPTAVGGIEDHVHILMSLKPSHTLSKVMRELKADSSRWIKKELKRPTFSWQEGYGAFTVSAPGVEDVRSYVIHQKERHQQKSYQEEYLEMLGRGMIEFDDRYLW